MALTSIGKILGKVTVASSPRSGVWIQAAARHQGRRPYQEDDYGVFELPAALAAGELLLVLADGMGGAQAGDRASAAAVQSFIDAYAAIPYPRIPDRLRRALDHANREIALEIAADPRALRGMGCTLLAVVLTADHLYWISVGDSPLWLWRKGELIRLNRDHSYRYILAQRIAMGEITPEEAAIHPDRSALLSALTGDYLTMVDLRDEPYPLQPGDRIILSSDGLLTLTETDMSTSLATESNLIALCQNLINATLAADLPHQDNVTVMIAERRIVRAPSRSLWWTAAGVVVLLALTGWWWWQQGYGMLYAPPTAQGLAPASESVRRNP